ncbi:hypothetical protein [Calothrix sp. NIES-2100]|uniref:hypothetical protein n=1 Tax=Calothrix sp. NIES-2100 TaxID=1954172 RepID=UPI0030DD3F36
MHLPFHCSPGNYHHPDKFFDVLSLLWFTKQKKPPEGVSQPGELVIRVHLPFHCSQVNPHAPDRFTKMFILVLCDPA